MIPPPAVVRTLQAEDLEVGGALYGFDAGHADLNDYSERAKVLYKALRLDVDVDRDAVLGRLPDGRWALVDGDYYAVEIGRMAK